MDGSGSRNFVSWLITGKMIGSVGDDVLVHQWRYPRQVLIQDGLAGGPQHGDYFHDGHGVPDQNRIRQQAQTTGLVHDLLVVAGAELAAVSEEQPARQGVARLTAIELELDPPPEVFLVNVAQDVDGLDDTP